MAYPETFNREGSGNNSGIVVRRYQSEIHRPRDLAVPQSCANQTLREQRAIDGCVNFVEKKCESTDMVLVPVGDEYSTNAISMLAQVGQIWDQEVDTEHVLFGKPDSGVDNDDIGTVLQQEQILANFAESS